MRARIDRFGRILIPKKLRLQLGLKVLSPVCIKKDGIRIIIESIDAENPIVEKDGFLVYTGKIKRTPEYTLNRERNERNK